MPPRNRGALGEQREAWDVEEGLLLSLEEHLDIARSVKHADDLDPLAGESIEDEVIPESGHGPAPHAFELLALVLRRGAGFRICSNELVAC